MAKQKYYLSLYDKWMETGRIPYQGLCLSIGSHDVLLELFSYGLGNANYWAYDGEYRGYFNKYNGEDHSKVFYDFTPLRQTIVLLMAAMNNEL